MVKIVNLINLQILENLRAATQSDLVGVTGCLLLVVLNWTVPRRVLKPFTSRLGYQMMRHRRPHL